jgi:hypothetical protein
MVVDIVGNEKIYARQQQGFAKRFKLVGINADAGAERSLKDFWIGGSDTIPTQRVNGN